MTEHQFFTYSRYKGVECKYGVLTNDEGLSISPMDQPLESASWGEVYQLLRQRHEMKQG